MQTMGIIHAGLSMLVIYMDNPHGYVCRISRSEEMEVPDCEENFFSALMVISTVLNLKAIVRETIEATKNKKFNKSLLRQAANQNGLWTTSKNCLIALQLLKNRNDLDCE